MSERNGGARTAPRTAADLFATDFDALREGDRFATRGRTVTEADIVSFAGLTGDWHPQHADADWAARSRFGERIAHGMLVLSIAVGLLPLDPDRVLALRRLREVTFKRPVRIDDTIHVEGSVATLRPLDDATGLVGCQWRVANHAGELVARAQVEVLWRRGPVEAPRNGSGPARAAAEPEWGDALDLRAAFLVGEDDAGPWGVPPL